MKNTIVDPQVRERERQVARGQAGDRVSASQVVALCQRLDSSTSPYYVVCLLFGLPFCANNSRKKEYQECIRTRAEIVAKTMVGRGKIKKNGIFYLTANPCRTPPHVFV